MNATRIAFVTVSSILLDSALIYFAYKKKQQFYPTVIYLTKTRIFLTAFLLQLLAVIFQIAYGFAKLFFGQFQRIEIDNLVTRYWFAVVDICLIFASFQEELNLSFLFTFTILMIIKGFHWLLEERIDYMQTTPEIPRKFHIRAICLLVLLSCFDLHYVRYLLTEPIRHYELVFLAIGAEYCVLLISLISTMVRYVFHTIDSYRSTPWEEKKMYLLICDIFLASSKLLVYLNFLTSLWKFHPLPLFLVRPIYLSLRFLVKSLQDFYLSRRAIQYMNTAFKDATEQDLSGSSDKTCIICFEEMLISCSENVAETASSRSRYKVKKLPCGHMFHFFCLRDWFLTHQNCPTCRLDVIAQARSQNRANRSNRAPSSANGNSQSAQSNNQSNQPAQASPNPPYGMGQAEWLRFFQNGYFGSIGQSVPQQSSQAQSSGTDSAYPPTMVLNNGYPLCMPIILPGNAFTPGVFPTTPMPEPPSDLNGSYLDEAALRSSVEARIAALRQVQTLLDAAMLQVNAYVAATANLDQEAQANNKAGVPIVKTEQKAESNSS